jgi:ribose 5-phosphate isomerase A
MRVISIALLSAASVNAFTPIAAPATRRLFTSLSAAAMSQDELKKEAGYKAVDDYVKSGMVVGLGTGSTAYFAVERVGQKLKSGELKDILAIPTSVRTKEQALSLDIPLVTLDTHSKLDVAIDGADHVDPGLCMTKGGGGALLREKMVEIMAEKFIVIGKQQHISVVE